MKIAIDCRSLRKPPAGVPNFLLSVINTLAVQKKDWTIYLLSNEDFHDDVKKRLVHTTNIIKVIEPLFAFRRIAILWYVLKVPFLVKKLETNLFYTPIPNLPPFLPGRIKTLITLHDMVYKHFPRTMSLTNWWINFFLHNSSVKNADYIWTVSDYTRKETELLFPIRQSKIIFTGSSIDKNVFHPEILSATDKQKILSKFDLQEKFLIFVGTQEPRKNLRYLLSLMPLLVSQGFSLLIVGAKAGANQI